MSNSPFPRSPYDEINGLVYFPRMADKARRHAAGKLPDDYVLLLGPANPTTFDGRCCRLLGVDYDAFVAEVKKGRSDEELYAWAIAAGREPSPAEKNTWNNFLSKRGWRDEASQGLSSVTLADGQTYLPLTYFDQFDAEEGRPIRHPGGPQIQRELPPPRPLFADLRSAYDTLGGIVHLPRLIDKTRLFRAGKLPSDWAQYRGAAQAFDGMCCAFLGVSYLDLEKLIFDGASDDSIVSWVHQHGKKHTPEEIKIWNTFLAKRCWRDDRTAKLQEGLQEMGLPVDTVLTRFDYLDLDEGRPVRPLSWTLPY